MSKRGSTGTRYSTDFKHQFFHARKMGLSIRELELKFQISRATASAWAKGVPLCAQGKQRLKQKLSRDPQSLIQWHREVSRRKRESAYQRGLKVSLSLEDAMCVGLYMGEGGHNGKLRPSWCFSNTNREMVRLMYQWAVRAGQPPQAFRASIQIHPEDDVKESVVSKFWADVGIPEKNIHIYRIRSKSSKKKITRKTPFGVCHLFTYGRGSGVCLFALYEGQRDQLVKMARLSI